MQLFRPAYPDELRRVKSLFKGEILPPSAQYLVAIVELPVERLIAAIAYWKYEESENSSLPIYEFCYVCKSETADQIIMITEAMNALDYQLVGVASRIVLQASLPESHPYFSVFCEFGFEVERIELEFSVPGEVVKKRHARIYKRMQQRVPECWRIESIRGQSVAGILPIVLHHELMTSSKFQKLWDTASPGHFDERYSFVLIDKKGDKKGDQDEIIGVILLSLDQENDLFIHIEAAHPARQFQSSVISATLRHHAFSQCHDGFPDYFNCRADTELHKQTINTAQRHGAKTYPPQYYLSKSINDRTV